MVELWVGTRLLVLFLGCIGLIIYPRYPEMSDGRKTVAYLRFPLYVNTLEEDMQFSENRVGKALGPPWTASQGVNGGQVL